ncbi:hypothetical protein BGZ83_000892 [Gryganskiella cystojenkinii]|nr:hypothetical protein BGZ83_000892 [Gryganskiella cystojenkinii]
MNLPEILDSIAQRLDPVSLVASTQVSHLWHECFTPILWQTISSTDWSLSDFSPRQLYDHGLLVRTLEWHSVFSQQHSSEQLQQYQSFFDRLGRRDKQQQDCATTASKNPSSSFDDSKKAETEQKLHDHADDELRKMLWVMQQAPLTDSTSSSHHLPMKCLVRIIGRCEHLQVLKLNLGCPNSAVSTKEGENVLGLVRTLQSLRFLQELELVAHAVHFQSIKDAEDGEEEESLDHSTAVVFRGQLNVLAMINNLAQLETLTLRGSAFAFNTLSTLPVSSSLPPSNPTILSIRRLSLEPSPSALTEQALTSFLQQCPRLESLSLPGSLAWEISDDFIHHLNISCPNLDSFSINASLAVMRAQNLISTTTAATSVSTLTEQEIGTPASESNPAPMTAPSIILNPNHARIIPEDDRLAALIRGIRKPLRKFEARACFFGDETLQALEDRCLDLERLDISLNRGSSMSPATAVVMVPAAQGQEPEPVPTLCKHRLARFFRGCKKLTELIADGVWIDLSDLQPSEEEGEEQDLHEQNSEGPHPDQHQQQEQQQPSLACAGTLKRLVLGFSTPSSSLLYTFLSSLRNLQTLQISHTTLTDLQPPQLVPSTVTATQSPSPSSSSSSSSFHLLSNLQDLREFDIETCSYTSSALLNQETVQWMVSKAWPKLERLQVQRLGASQERDLLRWLQVVDREDLIVNGSHLPSSLNPGLLSPRKSRQSSASGSDKSLDIAHGEGHASATQAAIIMSMMMSY